MNLIELPNAKSDVEVIREFGRKYGLKLDWKPLSAAEASRLGAFDGIYVEHPAGFFVVYRVTSFSKWIIRLDCNNGMHNTWFDRADFGAALRECEDSIRRRFPALN